MPWDTKRSGEGKNVVEVIGVHVREGRGMTGGGHDRCAKENTVVDPLDNWFYVMPAQKSDTGINDISLYPPCGC